jgi:dihydrofolate reductase
MMLLVDLHMRKIISYINSTLNGVVTGDPAKDKTNFMVWTTEAFIKAGSECALKTMQSVDTILLGRKTYEDLSRPEKWPSVKEWANGDALALALGEKINNAHKLVVSHSRLNGLKWGNFEEPKPLTGNNIEEQVAALKKGNGGDIIIFGSPTLVRSLTNANLVDEFHLQVLPVVVNVGEQLFDGLHDRKDLRLLEVQPLVDGTLFIKYQPMKGC